MASKHSVISHHSQANPLEGSKHTQFSKPQGVMLGITSKHSMPEFWHYINSKTRLNANALQKDDSHDQSNNIQVNSKTSHFSNNIQTKATQMTRKQNDENCQIASSLLNSNLEPTSMSKLSHFSGVVQHH